MLQGILDKFVQMSILVLTRYVHSDIEPTERYGPDWGGHQGTTDFKSHSAYGNKESWAKQWPCRLKCIHGEGRNILNWKMKQWFGGSWRCRRLELPHPENNGSNSWHRENGSGWSATEQTEWREGSIWGHQSKTKFIGKSDFARAPT